MRPIPVPDEWVGDGTRRVLAAPDGDLTNPDIAPLEVLVRGNTFTSYWVAEPTDAAPFLVVGLTCHGVQPPVSLTVLNKEDYV